MPTVKEIKTLGLGLGVDGAAIFCMVMQALHPGTYWDYLGSAGYFVQLGALAMGLLLLPLMLVVIHALVKMQENNHPALAKVKNIDSLVEAQNHSVFYTRWLVVKELAICLIFSSMGWIWLAMANLVCLFLVHLVWASPKLMPTPGQTA